MSVVIETTLGDLTVDLFTDERPIALQQGFIAQTGDPTGAGDGGSSVWGVVEGSQKRFFEAEYLPKIHHTNAGTLSLVSAGKNLVGSQFFFTLGENLTSLDGTHCVIGEVVEGHDLLRKLNDTIVDDTFRPYQDIRITHTVVLDDPFPNPRGFQVPNRSPSPNAERLKNGRIAADEDIDDTGGKTMEELQEMLAEREAKARATILEIVGDLPDADMAPPENVLFVCKLNPVTTDDDLEIIFSRFGVVKSCEVIRDRKSGDSLQYAFVEFEDQKSCEAAYFKMDNVLIDDRRIHVDFSQSVSKVTWRGKGRGVIGDNDNLDFNNLKEKSGNGSTTKYNKGRVGGRGNDRMRDEQRSRMSSAERIKARELRHQEQRHREDRTAGNHLKRSKSREHNDRHRQRFDRRSSRSKERTDRRISRSRERTDGRAPRSREQTDRRVSRSRERSREQRRSPRSRERNDRRIPSSPYRANRKALEPRRQEDRRNRSSDRTERSSLKNREQQVDEKRRRDYKNKRPQNPGKDRKRKAVEKESKSKKKSKSARKSSSESSDSSDDTDSSSDSSDESSSSSSDERSKRKKKTKSKHKKSSAKRKHKSNKKHKK